MCVYMCPSYDYFLLITLKCLTPTATQGESLFITFQVYLRTIDLQHVVIQVIIRPRPVVMHRSF